MSASAIGWYGEDRFKEPNGEKGTRPFVEPDPPALDFLGQTCVKWEESIEPVTSLGKRLVKLRTGIVLSKKGGALDKFRSPLKLGVATILGNGKQVASWIHIDDLTSLYISAIENESMRGVYNAVAPHPVTNKELVVTLAKSKRRSFIPVHVPTFMLKLMLGEMSVEVLKSATVSAGKILHAGFEFKYPFIEQAITE